MQVTFPLRLKLLRNFQVKLSLNRSLQCYNPDLGTHTWFQTQPPKQDELYFGQHMAKPMQFIQSAIPISLRMDLLFKFYQMGRKKTMWGKSAGEGQVQVQVPTRFIAQFLMSYMDLFTFLGCMDAYFFLVTAPLKAKPMKKTMGFPKSHRTSRTGCRFGGLVMMHRLPSQGAAKG